MILHFNLAVKTKANWFLLYWRINACNQVALET